MSRTVRGVTCRALLLAAALFALALVVFAQASYTWRNVQIYGGGFITGIVFNQTEANLVYVRTDIGGAYRLDNTTSRWVPLLDATSWDDWNLTGVISLATDPVNPNNVYIAAGTYTNNFASQNGAILRSTLSFSFLCFLCLFVAEQLMTNRRKLNVYVAVLVLTALCLPAHAQNSYQATLSIRLDQPRSTINRNLYGQFAEHLGRLIYDGLWVGENSPIPNTRGLRNDVVGALKELHVPVLRWPGGCFADEYHWRDGIGPRDKRPRRPNSSWGGVDTNAFGTHEFLDLCEMLGADAYINGNVGSGSPQEMMEWIEYMTSDADSELANLRRRNGRDKPWKIPFFAVGNETWGCGGNMRPEYYADVYRQYATFIKNHSGNRIQKLAVGGYDENYNWTEVLMAQAAKQMDGLSLHYYTLPTGNWDKKGSATQFDEKEWHATLVRALRMDQFIQRHSAIMDKYDPQKRVGLMVDEWGTWYDKEPGRDMGALYQQNTLRDAVAAAINLNIFNKHADRVKMANIAQMVNVLQAMVLTDKEKMVLTPTYYVFRMYRVHQGATLIPVDLSAPEYKLGDASVPSLNASASRDGEGRLHVSVVNLDPNRAAEIATTIWGGVIKSVSGVVLTAPAVNAMNTFDQPNKVKPAPFSGYKLNGSQLTLSIPAKSVVVLEFN